VIGSVAEIESLESKRALKEEEELAHYAYLLVAATGI